MMIVGTYSRHYTPGQMNVAEFVTDGKGNKLYNQPIYVIRQTTYEEYYQHNTELGVKGLPSKEECAGARFYVIHID